VTRMSKTAIGVRAGRVKAGLFGIVSITCLEKEAHHPARWDTPAGRAQSTF
jgi:hypothetical protein